MCGIVGYVGKKEIDAVLLKALSRLEYRGYDSAGIAALNRGDLEVLKESGKLQELAKLVDRPFDGTLGIGHTRWATHGEPSRRNAHPHTDCGKSIAVVHNGIIENHGALRKRLTEEGHVFNSDTDTEVLAHLVENHHLKEGHDLETAVRMVLGEIEGSYAMCVISKNETERFVAARNGSPLVIGVGEGENFVASDAPALLDFTRDVIFLEDYEMAVVSKNDVKVTSRKGDPVQHKINRIDYDPSEVTKKNFQHYMLKEIQEQPFIVDRIIRRRLSEQFETSLFDILRFDINDLVKTERVFAQACGTSWHAALTGKFMLERLAGLPTEVDVSSEFRYRGVIPQPRSIILSITQSGETIDTLMGIRHGKERGFKTLSICNVLGSTVSRESDGVIYTHGGPEIGVASTKAYTAQLTILFLLGLFWGKHRNFLSEKQYDHYASELRTIPEKMEKIVHSRDTVRAVAEKYQHSRDFLFLARGVNYPNAHEGALKIKEIAYIHATGHPAGEMKHGPIALIDASMPVVAIATKSPVYEKMLSNIQEVKARNGKIIAIVNEGDLLLKGIADDVIEIPETDELLSPLLAALPLQYLAYYVAALRGTDIDQPRNLAKSVTVE